MLLLFIYRFQESGIITYSYEEIFRKYRIPCFRDGGGGRESVFDNVNVDPTILNLQKLSGAFYVLAIGWLLAALGFVAELMVTYFKNILN